MVNVYLRLKLNSLNTKFECLVPLPCQVHCQAALGEIIYLRPLGEARGTLVGAIGALGYNLQELKCLRGSHVVIIIAQAIPKVVITTSSVARFTAKGCFNHGW